MDNMESIKKLEEEWTINRQKHVINREVLTDAGDEEILELHKLLHLLEAAEVVNKLKNPQLQFSMIESEATISNLHVGVELPKIISLLESERANVRISAAKYVCILACEEANQIIEAGGLSSLLMLLRNKDETTRGIAASAIANLAINDINQELIMIQGGIDLLAMVASEAEYPYTLQVVATAIANMCGNGKLHVMLRSQGGIKTLLEMPKTCSHPDVLSEVYRGLKNFAECDIKEQEMGRVV